MNSNTIKILHLSDFYFENKNENQDKIFNSLVSTIEKEHNNKLRESTALVLPQFIYKSIIPFIFSYIRLLLTITQFEIFARYIFYLTLQHERCLLIQNCINL